MTAKNLPHNAEWLKLYAEGVELEWNTGFTWAPLDQHSAHLLTDRVFNKFRRKPQPLTVWVVLDKYDDLVTGYKNEAQAASRVKWFNNPDRLERYAHRRPYRFIKTTEVL